MKYRMAIELKKWLDTLDRVDSESTEPVLLSIGKTVYSACVYSMDNEISAIYVLGKLPSSYVNYHAHYYKDESDNHLYISGYYQEPNPKYDRFHPFGIHFQLHYIDDFTRLRQYTLKPTKCMRIKIRSVAHLLD